CSHEKFLNAMNGLGEAEIQNMIKEDLGAEAVCHFCGNKYKFTEEELNVLIESLE
ncbi:Hsp33 family molecular chaperone HslO, partial [Staphylococcus aureus]|nr:Hsp33 family molecular chaperone HslO [Staphylococcus aureus]